MFILFGSFFIFIFCLFFSTILQYFPQIGAPGMTNNFIFFSIVGTLLYTLSGWLIGYLKDKYSQRRLKKLGTALPEEPD